MALRGACVAKRGPGRRPLNDPNALNKFTPKRWPKTAAEHESRNHHGKIQMTVSMPPYLYDSIRAEAIAGKRSMNSVALEMLEAQHADDVE